MFWKAAASLSLILNMGMGLFAVKTVITDDNHAVFDEITVERVNIVEPDGQYSMVLANTQRMQGPIMEGQLLFERQNQNGIIFFNPDGDEVGGIVFQNFNDANGDRQTMGSITIDQYRQNAVVNLFHAPQGSGRMLSGLAVTDRPTDLTMLEIRETQLAMRGEGEEAEAARERYDQWREESRMRAHRVFLGSDDRTAMLDLKDTQGKPRLRFAVLPDDTVQIVVLDEDGEVVETLFTTVEAE